MNKSSTPPAVPQTKDVTNQRLGETSPGLALTPLSDPYARIDPRRISLLDSMEKQFEKIFGGQTDEK